ncbi:50S ribosomal protein L32e [Candidatus Bathyarchaeota archaeon]|nr:MAG: 50S ribosomal protein L32e [Candidatus Bathyarchaeota archaeon]
MMKSSKPEFKRQESWRYRRVAENWRRPRGVTSKMRKEESGFPPKVKVGYGSIASARGLHPRGLVEHLVWRESELEKLDAKIHIIRIAARVGERKRIGIVAKAKEQNFHIANPGKGESRPVAETVEEREPVPTETPVEEPTEQVEDAEDGEEKSVTGEDSE